MSLHHTLFRFTPAAIAAGVLATSLGLGVPTMAQAQTQTRVTTATAASAPRIAPRISGFDVTQVTQIQPGTELDFSLWGTPDGLAQVRIDGAQRTLNLSEVSDGVYQGTYIVSTRDRIAPNARVTGTLRQGNLVTTATLDETLQVGAAVNPALNPASNPQPVVAPSAQITRVSVAHAVPTAAVGSTQRNLIRYTVFGTPGGKASISIPNVSPTAILLDEVRPGEYTGVHAMRATDVVNPNQPITARIVANNRTVTQTVERAWADVSLPNFTAPPCLNCAKVLAINEVQVDGDNPNILGTLGGGAIGGLLGTQVGQGRGKQIATVAGALGGALAGREIERRRNQTVRYEIVLGLDNGHQQTLISPTRPNLSVGDAVRVVDGQIQPR